jgi:serine protease Do
MPNKPAKDPASTKISRRLPLSLVSRNLVGASAVALCVIAGAGANQLQAAPAVAPQSETATQLPSFTALAERVLPSVVSVRVKADPRLVASQDGGAGDERSPDGNKENPFSGTPLERFFAGPKGLMPPDPKGKDKKGGSPGAPVLGQGSGFFISQDGYIVTNNHVVEGAMKVEVLTTDGRALPARIIGTDAGTDLALLKVDGRNFPAVTFSKGEVKVGEWVIALGNPFGLDGTVTAGIVSARGRDIGMGAYDNFIQIDASVNQGNSGGPTFNQSGEVIGVNTAIFSPSGGSVGIAFAVPAKTVETIVAQLKEKGRVTRGWLGVEVQPVTPELADSLGLRDAQGALVTSLMQGSPADKGGLLRGDVVLKINEGDVKDSRDLARRIAAIPPQTAVRLAIFRNGRREALAVKLTELKDESKLPGGKSGPALQSEIGGLGIAVAPMVSGPGGAPGLAIVDIRPDGRAADIGLVQGDVILAANGSDLFTPDALEAALRNARAIGKRHALTLVQRGATQVFVALPTGAS